MAKALATGLQAHLSTGLTTTCTLWKVTRRDGTILGFTDHNTNIDYDGLTYSAEVGYTASAVDSSSELNPDNLEMEGFLMSPNIVDADFHSGIWDYAAVEVFQINYVDPALGRNVLRVGTMGEIKGGRARFFAELRGLMQAYSKKIVRLTAKECDANFGDARCKMSANLFTWGGTVTTVEDNRILGHALAQATDYFTGGLLLFTSGANNALSMEVKRHTTTLELHEEMPYAIAVGDTFNVTAGCQKRLIEDCQTKFNNVLNFRGFPHLPLSDVFAIGGLDRLQ